MFPSSISSINIFNVSTIKESIYQYMYSFKSNKTSLHTKKVASIKIISKNMTIRNEMVGAVQNSQLFCWLILVFCFRLNQGKKLGAVNNTHKTCPGFWSATVDASYERKHNISMRHIQFQRNDICYYRKHTIVARKLHVSKTIFASSAEKRKQRIITKEISNTKEVIFTFESRKSFIFS